jgi:hypothetical protein
MGKSIGIKGLLARNFDVYGIEDEWIKIFGDMGKPFTGLVYGHPKNGKTYFMLKFCKYMTRFTKVYYNSVEQGESKTLQDAMIALKMDAIEDGKFILGDRDGFDDMMLKLETNRAGLVVIDSRDVMNMTVKQWVKLTTTYKRKSFILVCWESAKKPAGKYAKDILYLVDWYTHVTNFIAVTRSRFNNEVSTVNTWPERKQQYGGLFNPNQS